MAKVEYSIETKGIEEAAKLLSEYPEIAYDELVKTMVKVVFQVSSDAREFAPVNMGMLRSKIGGHVKPVGGMMRSPQGIVHSGGVPYALTMEKGRRPGKFPPLAPIRRWCHLVLGNADLAFLVARKIAREGIQGRYFFWRAWKKNQEWVSRQFELARDRIVQRLADIGIHVES